MPHKKTFFFLPSFVLILILFFVSACGGGEAAPPPLPTPIPETTSDEAATQTEAVPTNAPAIAENAESSESVATGGYPAPDAGYLGALPEGIQPEPPNPERQLPEAGSGTAVIGGVLIRELVEEGGFLPLTPQRLLLGEIVNTTDGQPAYLSVDDQNSPSAELFPTGVFLFSNVTPGTYGLVVDLGFTQFLVNQPDGSQFLFTVEPNQALDLGQVITQTTTE